MNKSRPSASKCLFNYVFIVELNNITFVSASTNNSLLKSKMSLYIFKQIFYYLQENNYIEEIICWDNALGGEMAFPFVECESGLIC